jgi:hypothetical protein
MCRRIAAAAALAAAVFIAAQSSQAARQATVSPPVAAPQAAQIVLPPQLETEKPATLAVLDSDGRLAAGVTVELPGGKKITTDATGRARFVVTSAAGPFVVQGVGGAPGTRARAVSMVVDHPAIPKGGSSLDLTVTGYPHVVALEDHIVVRGSGFRGDADLNHVTLGGQPALVMASSPVALVVQPGPETAFGSKEMIIEVAGRRSAPLALALLSLEITPPADGLAAGQRGNLIVHLNGTTQKVTMGVENLFGSAVGLMNGNFQRVTTTGGAQNLAFIPVRALRPGDFSVSLRVVTSAQDASALALARDEVVAARGLSEGAWTRAVDRLLVQLDRTKADDRGVSRLLDELEEMLSSNPPVGVLTHLREAWLDLIRD